MTNKEEFTIIFHVDKNLKLSHKDKEPASGIIANLESMYVTMDTMTVHIDKLHYYLGITMNFRVQGEVYKTMYFYIKKLSGSLTDDMKVSKHTAAPEYMFWTDDEQATKLSTELSDIFHKVKAQVLWVSKCCGRPDL